LKTRLSGLLSLSKKEYLIHGFILASGLGLSLSLFTYRIELEKTSSIDYLQSQVVFLQKNLDSVATTVILSTEFLTAVGEGNYAQTLEIIEHIKKSGVADFVSVFDRKSILFAEALRPGVFGKKTELSEDAAGAMAGMKSVSAIMTLEKGPAYCVLKKIESLNSALGTLAVCKDLKNYFGDKNPKFNRFADKIEALPASTKSDQFGIVYLSSDSSDSIPKGWIIRAYLQTIEEAKKLLLAVLFIGVGLYGAFLWLWLSYRKTQNELQLEQSQRVHSARLLALGEMCGGIAHEINSPLAIILGSAEQLNRHLIAAQLPEHTMRAALNSCQKIQTTVSRIAKIIKGMRTFARDASDDPMEISDLGPILKDTLDMAQAKIKGTGVRLKIQIGDEPVYILCRSVQISQVILNLLNNAVDAVEAHNDSWVEIHLFSQQGRAVLHITDSGAGIPAALRTRIMDPFFTTKPVGKGTGLGLSIAVGVLKSHNGQLSIDESCPNTRFVVTLPLAEQKPVAQDPVAA
jgi:signal transduction histidine kinase